MQDELNKVYEDLRKTRKNLNEIIGENEMFAAKLDSIKTDFETLIAQNSLLLADLDAKGDECKNYKEMIKILQAQNKSLKPKDETATSSSPLTSPKSPAVFKAIGFGW